MPDERVADAGRLLAELPFVTLCYRRPRRLPVWPYNLFCMIHGRDRATVEALVDQASAAAGLGAAAAGGAVQPAASSSSAAPATLPPPQEAA